MKVTVTEDFGIQLEEVFSGLTLKTESGETMIGRSIAMNGVRMFGLSAFCRTN